MLLTRDWRTRRRWGRFSPGCGCCGPAVLCQAGCQVALTATGTPNLYSTGTFATVTGLATGLTTVDYWNARSVAVLYVDISGTLAQGGGYFLAQQTGIVGVAATVTIQLGCGNPGRPTTCNFQDNPDSIQAWLTNLSTGNCAGAGSGDLAAASFPCGTPLIESWTGKSVLNCFSGTVLLQAGGVALLWTR